MRKLNESSRVLLIVLYVIVAVGLFVHFVGWGVLVGLLTDPHN